MKNKFRVNNKEVLKDYNKICLHPVFKKIINEINEPASTSWSKTGWAKSTGISSNL